MSRKSGKVKWVRYRHKVITALLRLPVRAYVDLRYRIKIRRFRESRKRQFFVLSNHQTPFDEIFLSLAFAKPVYYFATEDIFSNGAVSSLLRFFFAPIPIKKAVQDLNALKYASKVAKEGGTIGLFPEGNRTYSGKTETIKPSVIKLIRLLKLPVAIFKIEGGFGAEPRWSDRIRKGPVRCGVTKVFEPEEVAAMSNDELCDAVIGELQNDDTLSGECYSSKRSAEYLERVLYMCPECGLSEFESKGDECSCKKCGLSFAYGADLSLKPLNGSKIPYSHFKEWYDAQEAYARKLDLTQFSEHPAYEDKVTFSKVHVCERKEELCSETPLRLYGDRLCLMSPGQLTIMFDDVIAMTALGRNKLNVYVSDDLFQIRGTKRFNPIKYMHFFYRYKMTKGENNEQFLGL